MTTFVRFLDNDRRGRWANIKMDNGDPCWVSIAQSGVLIRKSKVGFFGAKLFDESNVYKLAKAAMHLDESYESDLTPEDMWNPILKAFVNTILHSSDLGEVTRILNEAYAAQSDAE